MHWPIFVVSHTDAHDRRESITRQFERHGLGFEFIDAVDGRNGLPTEYESRIDRAAPRAQYGRDLSDAEFACALSHQSIYERIVQEGLPGAVVLEDDVILTEAFIGFIRGKIYVSGDFIQFDYNNARSRYWSRRRRITGIDLIPLAQNSDLASGYSLTQTAAAYILSKSRPVAGVADWPCDLIPVRPMVTQPRLVSQAERVGGQSTLEDLRKTLQSTIRRPPYFRDGEEFQQIRWKRYGRASYWKYVWGQRGSGKMKQKLLRTFTTRRIEGSAQ